MIFCKTPHSVFKTPSSLPLLFECMQSLYQDPRSCIRWRLPSLQPYPVPPHAHRTTQSSPAAPGSLHTPPFLPKRLFLCFILPCIPALIQLPPVHPFRSQFKRHLSPAWRPIFYSGSTLGFAFSSPITTDNLLFQQLLG